MMGYYRACMMGYYGACVIGYYGIWVLRACPVLEGGLLRFLTDAGYYRK